VLDAPMCRGRSRRRWRAADPLAADELEHRAHRTFGLADLTQQPTRGVDLGAAVVDVRDEPVAGLDLASSGWKSGGCASPGGGSTPNAAPTEWI
jgi:hypothetical protein